MVSSNLLKSKIPMLRVGGPHGNQFLKVNFKFSKSSPEMKFPFLGGLVEFDAEFKFAKIQNSRVEGGGGESSWNLMVSSNLLKSKIPMLRVGVGAHGNQFLKVNFKFSKSSPELKFPFSGGGLMECMDFGAAT